MDAAADSGAYALLLVDDLERVASRAARTREETWDRVWRSLWRWSRDRPVYAAMRSRPLHEPCFGFPGGFLVNPGGKNCEKLVESLRIYQLIFLQGMV